MFEPFHDLAEAIRTALGAEIVDDENFEKMPYSPNFIAAKEVFQEASRAHRHFEKFSNALSHDAVVFLSLGATARATPDQTWMVTRDASLPSAWTRLQPEGITIRAFLLDGLLQCISPFIVEEDVKNFSELFSEAITAQLLPQVRVFDIDDFLLFQDIELDCKELTDDEVQEGLSRVKKHVLHGASYRHEDLAPAAYELRRFFATRKERYELLTKEKERLEHAIVGFEGAIEELDRHHSKELVSLGEKHASDVRDLEQRLGEFEEREARLVLKKKRRLLLMKKSACLLSLVGIEWVIIKLGIKLGEGTNLAMRIASFWPYLTTGALVWLAIVKLVFFRRDRLRDVFPTLAEIKDLSPWG